MNGSLNNVDQAEENISLNHNEINCMSENKDIAENSLKFNVCSSKQQTVLLKPISM